MKRKKRNARNVLEREAEFFIFCFLLRERKWLRHRLDVEWYRKEDGEVEIFPSLFSQYVKEKGFSADLGLEMTSRSLGKRDAYKVPKTLSLLDRVQNSGNDQKDMNDGISNASRSMAPPAETKPEKAQLTIFYGGKVIVFDNFPAEKAEDLMQFASKSSGMVSGAQSLSLMPSNSMAVVDCSSFPTPANSPANFPPRPQPNFSNLPLARKASLQRFLAMRKDRISAKALHQMGSSEGIKSDATLKEDISQPWLGLGSQFSS